MFSRLNREFGQSLPLATLLEHPTIAQLAPLLEPKQTIEAPSEERGSLVTLCAGSNETPLFCIHGGDGGVIFYRSLAALMPGSLPFHAIESRELGSSGPVSQCSVAETAASYIRVIRSIQPSGPYQLAGYSFGGVVAFEMACQLRKQGETVEFLGLFDTHNPAVESRTYGLSERLKVFWTDSDDKPLAQRVARLGGRIREGVATNRRVKSEIGSARDTAPGQPFSDLRRIQVREENWRAMQEWKPSNYPGDVTLFKTTHVNDKIERPPDYGWTEVTNGSLNILPVTGPHLDLFEADHVETLASALRQAVLPTPQHELPPSS